MQSIPPCWLDLHTGSTQITCSHQGEDREADEGWLLRKFFDCDSASREHGYPVYAVDRVIATSILLKCLDVQFPAAHHDRFSVVKVIAKSYEPSLHSSSVDRVRDGSGGGLVHRGEDVAVGVEGDGDGGVAEALGNHLGGLAGEQCCGGRGVAEVVEADRG